MRHAPPPARRLRAGAGPGVVALAAPVLAVLGLLGAGCSSGTSPASVPRLSSASGGHSAGGNRAAELHAAARATALAIASRAPASVVSTKALMRDESVLLARMGQESTNFLRQLKSAEFKEAFTAFSERRAPDFSKFG